MIPEGFSIRLSVHATFQLQSRCISEAEVEACLRSPLRVIKQEGGRWKAVRFSDLEVRKLLVVVYEEFRDHVLVITVFRTSKVKKYI